VVGDAVNNVEIAYKVMHIAAERTTPKRNAKRVAKGISIAKERSICWLETGEGEVRRNGHTG
jgi:hypothetical protein